MKVEELVRGLGRRGPTRATIATLLLGPILVAQGRMVRKRALILPEPAGERSGQLGSGPRLKLLILGDSSAAGVGVATQDDALSGRLVDVLSRNFHVDWRLWAATGLTTSLTLASLRDRPAVQFDVVVTALGVNDVTGMVRLGRWLEQKAMLWDMLRKDFGARRIYVSGLPPMGVFPILPQPLRWVLGERAWLFDAALAKAAATRPWVAHVKAAFPTGDDLMAEDGFHPAPSVYRAWAQIVAARINADCADGILKI